MPKTGALANAVQRFRGFVMPAGKASSVAPQPSSVVSPEAAAVQTANAATTPALTESAVVQPLTGDEAPVGPVASPEDEDLPNCGICLQPLRPQEDKTALPCCHVHHDYCLHEWRECANKMAHECPFQRHESTMLHDVEAMSTDAQAGQSSSSSAAAPGVSSEEISSRDAEVSQSIFVPADSS